MKVSKLNIFRGFRSLLHKYLIVYDAWILEYFLSQNLSKLHECQCVQILCKFDNQYEALFCVLHVARAPVIGTNHRFLLAQPKLSDHCPYLETKSQTNPSPVFSSAPGLWPSAKLYISLCHCVGDWVTRWVRKLKISVNIDARTLKFGMEHPWTHWLRFRKNQF